MSLFQHVVIKKQIASQSSKIKTAYELFAAYFHNTAIQENILASKEEQFQEGFLRELFVNVLGYTLNPDANYNLITERKNEKDSKKADGAIILKGEVVGIIELKDHKTIDLKQIETQAFGYKNNNRKASYVITSNFEKLRFYIENAIDFVEFNLFTLSYDEFSLLWLCLAYENIAKDLPKQLKTESVNSENDITKKLYKDYSEFKRALFADMVANNSAYDKLTLFKKSQKLLDRLLFIFFAEDCGLLPANSIAQIVEQWETLKDLDAYTPLYDRMKMYFGYMNTGHKGKKHDIFAYNGGLFKPDEVLDTVLISDEVLREHALRISNYNFASEVDVNILGHIFENSLTEIEEITNELSLTRELAPLFQKQTSKRKKDGVFYTPRYITAYIVENTLGKLCSDKKAELEIVETEYFADKKRQTATKKVLDDKLQTYREWLLQLTICDPACGSGAFLNAALDYLMNEHKLLDELTAKILTHSIAFADVENAILENNLFGVDINEESVEIAKLALWLRTAKPHRKLNSLNNNIKCGNSLISDPEVAGDKAFDWQREFPQVFREKQKKAFHITTAIHDSRTSERMVEYKVRELRDNGLRPNADPIWLDMEEELLITKTIAEIVAQDNLNMLAYIVCGDHVHFLIVCEEEEVVKIVQKIKSITAKNVNIARGVTIARGHDPLSILPIQSILPTQSKNKSTPFWTQKFGCKEITDEKQLYNTIEYIEKNREKHGLPFLLLTREQAPLLTTIDHAFRPEYSGGFDVVIGNPPYVFARENGTNQEKSFYAENYISAKYQVNTYILFIEKSFQLVKQEGFCGLIIPNSWLMIYSGEDLRKFIMQNCTLDKIANLKGKSFEDANVETVILIAEKTPSNTHTVVEILSSDERSNSFVLMHTKNQTDFTKNKGLEFNVFSDDESSSIVNKLKNGSKDLDEVCSVKAGLKAYEKGKGTPMQSEADVKERPYDFNYQYNDDTYQYLDGSNVQRYGVSWSGLWLWYGQHLAAPRNLNLFTSEKIIIREITGKYPKCIIGTYSDKALLFNMSNIAIIKREEYNVSLKYVTAIINSTLLSYYFTKNTAKAERKLFPKIILNDLRLFPIKYISPEAQQPLIDLADKMLALSSDLQILRSKFLRRLQDNLEGIKITGVLDKFETLEFAAFVKELAKQKIKLSLKQQDEWEEYFNDSRTACIALSAEISVTDHTIDTLVYTLYGLTEEEIMIIEK